MLSKIKLIVIVLWRILYTRIVGWGFKTIGKKSIIRPCADVIVGKEFIEIGANCIIGKHIQLTAWSDHNGVKFKPSIKIGSNSQFGSYNHITSINRIEIGEGVLTGKFVTITDNSHGKPNDDSESDISPVIRTIYSKGPVIIGNNVWIGDKVTILPNVSIGDSCIIGANSVVTKDIPAYSIIGGNPARIIRTIK